MASFGSLNAVYGILIQVRQCTRIALRACALEMMWTPSLFGLQLMDNSFSRGCVATPGARRFASGSFLAFSFALAASFSTSTRTFVFLVAATRRVSLLVASLTECTFHLVLGQMRIRTIVTRAFAVSNIHVANTFHFRSIRRFAGRISLALSFAFTLTFLTFAAFALPGRTRYCVRVDGATCE